PTLFPYTTLFRSGPERAVFQRLQHGLGLLRRIRESRPCHHGDLAALRGGLFLEIRGSFTQEEAEFDSGRKFRGVFPEPASDRCGIAHGIIISAAVDCLGQRIQLEMVSRDDAEASGTRSARCPEIFRMLVLTRS